MTSQQFDSIVVPKGKTKITVRGGSIASEIQNVYSGRFYNNADWTPAAANTTNWVYLPSGQIGLAADVPPCINAAINGTSSQLNWTGSLLNIPVDGLWSLNMFVNAAQPNGGAFEISLSVYSSPAGYNQSAKTYGSGASTQQFMQSSAATLAKSVATNSAEASCSITCWLKGGTVIAPLLYVASAATPFKFPLASIYVTVSSVVLATQ